MELISVKQLHPSPFNPRKTAGPIDELQDSIEEHGVLQNLVARPRPAGGFELVVGHRRHHAAVKLGLSKVPVEVRELTDEQAREIQLVENLQRVDLHPMEEAEGYEGLQGLGRTVEQIAKKVKKSESWVRGRLTLLDLNEEGRKAFYRGDLNPTTALLIARLKKKGERVQEAGLKHITQKNRHGDVMGSREAAAALKHLLDEDEAPAARKATQLAGAKLVRLVRDRTRDFVLREVTARIEKKSDLSPADLRLALTARIEDGVPESVLRRRGMETQKQLTKRVATAPAGELRGLLVELNIADWLDDADDVSGARLKVTAKAYDIDYREAEQTARDLIAKEEQTGKADALFAKTR